MEVRLLFATKLTTTLFVTGSLEMPVITLSPAAEVKWGDRVEITCTVLTQQLGGTFVLKRTQDSVKVERFSENEAATFVLPNVDFSQSGSYYCEYQKKLPNQVIFYPPGATADLTVTGQQLSFCFLWLNIIVGCLTVQD